MGSEKTANPDEVAEAVEWGADKAVAERESKLKAAAVEIAKERAITDTESQDYGRLTETAAAEEAALMQDEGLKDDEAQKAVLRATLKSNPNLDEIKWDPNEKDPAMDEAVDIADRKQNDVTREGNYARKMGVTPVDQFPGSTEPSEKKPGIFDIFKRKAE